MTLHRFSRRKFLGAAAAGALLPMIGCGREDARLSEPVLVVGGGLAGLVALDRLVRAGREARLVSAGERLGGRVLTLREGLAPGLRAEAGAERVRRGDARLRALLAEHGLRTVSYPPATGPLTLELGGKRHLFRLLDELPASVFAGLSEAERAGAPLLVHQEIAARAKPPPTGTPMTGLAWLRENGMTARGEELVKTFCPMPIDRMPATVLRQILARERAAGQNDLIEGGSDRLIEALARPHRSRITLGVTVTSVAQDAGGVTVRDREGRAHRAARAVVCLPVPVLKRLEFEPAAPAELEAALRDQVVEHELKVHLQVRGAPAGEPGLGLHVQDRFPRVTWQLPEKGADGSCVLTTMALQEEVREVQRSLAGPELSALMARRLPHLARYVASATAHDFNADPLAGGAYTYSASGSIRQEPVARAGRIVFAGSDLSDLSGWMEGAVQSAEAAIPAVLS